MRFLLLSDIHSNLAAFDAVLADAKAFDRIWCLGDVIGYGPQPNECIDRLKQFPHVCVAGNHDWASIDRVDVSAFNPDALRACLWTREQLSPSSWEYIRSLPDRLVDGDFTVVHGSPRHPIWEYITHPQVAEANLSHFATLYCLFGHTHVPAGYQLTDPGGSVQEWRVEPNNAIPLGKRRLLVNPGGVGQPRDGDPRASYVILDPDERTMEHRRVEYAVERTQTLMISAKLPPRLVARLSIGW